MKYFISCMLIVSFLLVSLHSNAQAFPPCFVGSSATFTPITSQVSSLSLVGRFTYTDTALPSLSGETVNLSYTLQFTSIELIYYITTFNVPVVVTVPVNASTTSTWNWYAANNVLSFSYPSYTTAPVTLTYTIPNGRVWGLINQYAPTKYNACNVTLQGTATETMKGQTFMPYTAFTWPVTLGATFTN